MLQKRQQANIPVYDPWQSWRKLDWNKISFQWETDISLADKLGCPVGLVKQKRKELCPHPQKAPENWECLPLGKVSDGTIARATGRAQSAVSLARKRLGIPVFGDASVDRKPKGINWDKQPLGQVRDAELAKQLGVDLCSVARQRVKRGIVQVSKQARG